MIEIYDHAFTSKYGIEPDPESIWAMVLGDLTPNDIKVGLVAILNSGEKYAEWPPKPLEFKAMCMPSDEELGLPVERRAFMDAINWKNINHDEKNKAVYFAMSKMDIFSFQRLTTDKAERMFSTAWADVKAFVIDNGFDALPDIPIMLDKTTTDKAADTAKVETELAKMKKNLGIK